MHRGWEPSWWWEPQELFPFRPALPPTARGSEPGLGEPLGSGQSSPGPVRVPPGEWLLALQSGVMVGLLCRLRRVDPAPASERSAGVPFGPFHPPALATLPRLGRALFLSRAREGDLLASSAGLQDPTERCLVRTVPGRPTPAEPLEPAAAEARPLNSPLLRLESPQNHRFSGWTAAAGPSSAYKRPTGSPWRRWWRCIRWRFR